MRDFKVLFIYPNTMMATLVPISLSVLYPYLKAKGVQVELFDATFYQTEEESFEQRRVELLQLKEFNLEERGITIIKTDINQDLINKVQNFKPDLIGITMVEDTFPLAKSLLSSIEQFDIPVIAGGVFATLVPEEVIKLSSVDMLCIGEGEEPLAELCEKMSRGEDYSAIPNLWVKKDGEIIKNPLRPLIDLNKLPFLDYDIFDEKRLYRPMQGKTYTMIHVEMDRGCPFNCTYCEAPQLRRLFEENGCGNYYRRKSVDRIIDELHHLVKKYKPDYVNFDAESFLARPVEELRELAERYKEIQLPFWCQSRPETVTEEKIKILKGMNCKNLQFGIEHGNEAFRTKMLNRHYTNEQLISVLKIVEKYQIQYTVNNIIGFPDETRELIFDTIEINRLINPTSTNCFLFTPYKGTNLHKYCLEKGYLTNEDQVHQVLDSAELRMSSITYQEIKGLQRTFILYAKMPKKEWDKIKVAEKFDKKGNQAFQELRKVYYERYF
jgi:anaerobic magnesium-protoporphyrin IX monomethyl ester cyclase